MELEIRPFIQKDAERFSNWMRCPDDVTKLCHLSHLWYAYESYLHGNLGIIYDLDGEYLNLKDVESLVRKDGSIST